MNKLQLRSYQTNFIEEIKEAMRSYKHVAAQLPQGGGKGIIIAYMAYSSILNNKNVLIASHRIEINSQNSNILKDLGVKLQIVKSSTKKINTKVLCHVSMAQTLDSRCKTDPEFVEMIRSKNIILIDEFHLQYCDFIFEHASPSAWIIGLSGTVVRTGQQKQLGELYDCLVQGLSPSELIELKYIVPARCFTFVAPKLDNVGWNYHAGDWNQKDLAKVFGKRERYGGVVSEWFRICPNTKTLVFTTSSEHCVDLCIEFNKAGVKARYLLSKEMPDTDDVYSGNRTQLLKDFYEGDIDVMVNIDILTVGYNNPRIDTIVLDMATESYAKYSQAAARGCRPFNDKKSYFLLDFGGNIQCHGAPDADKEYSLWHNTGRNSGIPLTKVCPPEQKDIHGKYGCKRVIHIGYSSCPFCGYYFATNKEIYNVELEEIVNSREDFTVETIEQFVARKKLEGKGTNQILAMVCTKNKDNQKAAFMEALKVLKTDSGKEISPKYWYFFKKNILDKNKKK